MIAAAARALGFARPEAATVTSPPASEPLAVVMVAAMSRAIAAMLPVEVRQARTTAEQEARAVLVEVGEAGLALDALVARVGGSTPARRALALLALAGLRHDLAVEGDRIRLSDSILTGIRERAEREAAEAELTRLERAKRSGERAAETRRAAALADEAHSREQAIRVHPSGACRWSRCWVCASWPDHGLPHGLLAGHPHARCSGAGCIVCASWPAPLATEAA